MKTTAPATSSSSSSDGAAQHATTCIVALEHALRVLKTGPLAASVPPARAAAAVDQVARAAVALGGVPVSSLAGAADLLRFALVASVTRSSSSSSSGALVEPTARLLDALAAKEPLRCAASDAAREPGALCALLAALCDAFVLDDVPARLRAGAAAVVESVLKEGSRCELVLQSGVATALLARVGRELGNGCDHGAASSGLPLLCDLLHALVELTRWPPLCEQLASAGAVAVLARALAMQHGSCSSGRSPGGDGAAAYDVVPLALGAAWNVSELAPAAALDAAMCAPVEVSGDTACGGGGGQPNASTSAGAALATAIGDIAASLLVQQTSACGVPASCSERGLCNDALAALGLLLAQPMCAARMLEENESFDALLAAAVSMATAATAAARGGGGQGQLSNIKDRLEAERALLLWRAVSAAAGADGRCAQAAASSGLLEALLACVATTTAAPQQQQLLSSDLVGALRRGAWAALAGLAPLPAVADTFLRAAGGAAAIVALVRQTSSSGDGAPEDQPEAALRLISRLCSGSGAEAAVAQLLRAGAVEAVLMVLRQASHCKTAAAAITPANDSCRRAALVVLTAIANAGGAQALEAVRTANAVDVLVAELHAAAATGSSSSSSSSSSSGGAATLPPLSALAALGAVRACALADAGARADFLARGGLAALARVLESGHWALRPLALTALGDLLADGRAHGAFFEWRAAGSAASTPLPALLLEIWDAASRARGAVDDRGVIVSLEWPLGPPEGGDVQSCSGSSSGAIKSTTPITSSCLLPPSPLLTAGRGPLAPAYIPASLPPHRRALLAHAAKTATDANATLTKVYACLAQTGFDRCAAALRGGPTRALVALEAARDYERLCEGGEWRAVAAALVASGVTPCEGDAARLSAGIAAAEAAAASVRARQLAVLDAAAAEAAAAEAAACAAARAQAEADAAARKFRQDPARLTMRERLAARARRDEMLKHSANGGGGEAIVAAEAQARVAVAD